MHFPEGGKVLLGQTVERFAIRSILLVQAHPFLGALWNRLSKKRTGSISTPCTDICIEGFESSANSFTFNVIRHMGEGLNIAHHCHTVAAVKRALHYEVPTLILFRDPADAIPSLATRYRPSLLRACMMYVAFYQYVSKVSDRIILSSFEEVTQQIGYMLRKVSIMTDIKFSDVDDMSITEREVKRQMKNWLAENSDPHSMSLPTEARKENKRCLKEQLLTLEEYSEARRVYNRVVRAYERQEARIESRVKAG